MLWILVFSSLMLLTASAVSYAEEDDSTEFIFDVIIQNASFLPNGMIEFYGDINTSVYSDGEYEAVDAPTNVTLHSYGEDPFSEECEVSGSDQMKFHCAVENRSSYTMISAAAFDGETHYRYAEFDEQDIKDELLMETEEQTENLNLDVRFEEAYSDARITGTMTSDSLRDDDLLRVEVWPRDSEYDGYDERQTCTYTVSSTYDFSCYVNFTESGTYEINVTLISGDMEDSVREITYYSSPEYSVRIRHEGVYVMDDDVKVEAYAMLANREFTDHMNLSVESPDGIVYRKAGKNPVVMFAADEEGIYDIEVRSEHQGEIYTRESKLIVASEEMIGTPPSSSIVLDVSDFYAVNKELNIPVNLENVDVDGELPVTMIITAVDGDEIEISSVFTSDNEEITYAAEKPGRYRIQLRIDEIDLSTTTEIEVLSRADYARDAVLEPLIERENTRSQGSSIELSGIMFDDVADAYDIEFNLSRSSYARLKGIPSLNSILGIQSFRPESDRITTDIFAIDGINVTEAEISLEKEPGRDVEVIVYCKEWDYEAMDCDLWTLSDMDFEQNETHILFTVDSFSAYAGGDGFDSELTVWDDTSEDYGNDTAITGHDVGFYAEYLDFSTGEPIEDAICEINFTGAEVMSFNESEGIHEYERQFSEKGEYDYTVMCTSDDNDDLSVSNSLDVNSISYIEEMQLTRDNITLGYETGVSCRVIDAFSGEGIQDYEVEFHSDKEGLLGTQTTDNEGWSSIIFKPEILGDHNVSCIIDDDPGRFYVTGRSTLSEYLGVSPSDIFVDKDVHMSSFGEYDIELNITNRGNGRVYDVTIGDFVHSGFEAHFGREPDLNISTTIIGSGTLHYWNMGSLEGNESILLTYSISARSPSTFRLEKNTIIGGTYHLG